MDRLANLWDTSGLHSVKTLTTGIEKMHVRFDRAAYRKSYDAVYFKQRATCPRCAREVCKHMLKRHMQSKRCIAAARSFDADRLCNGC